MQPRKGSLARCSLGLLGLITEDGMQPVTYGDGSQGEAYVGIHLTVAFGEVGGRPYSVKPGDQWCSRNPTVVGHIDDINVKLV